jgi:hypothetical protein
MPANRTIWLVNQHARIALGRPAPATLADKDRQLETFRLALETIAVLTDLEGEEN